MNSIVFVPVKKKNKKRLFIRIFGLGLAVVGFTIAVYIFLPLISWHIFFADSFAAQQIVSPIPKTTMVNDLPVKELVSSAVHNLTGVDYNNAANWFPGYTTKKIATNVKSYSLAIPSLNITHAIVSTTDYDLGQHLVQYDGTPVPPEKGDTVIYGHSTIPSWFNPIDYHTIFANLYKIQNGDTILVSINDITYTYIVYATTVVSPEDTSIFTQDYDSSHITLVTCTPPGTTELRLIVRARLQ